jgi:CubicO group peptidase (beta-lactamase class C family)
MIDDATFTPDPSLTAAILAEAGAGPSPGRVAGADVIAAAARAALRETGAQGLAVATFDRGQVRSVQAFGERNAQGDPLTADSVMHAAALTKVVFGWLAVQLADEGRFDLDRPIARLLARPLPHYGNLDAYGRWGDLADDGRWAFITPRMVLNHTAGFADSAAAQPDSSLRIQAEPGARYRYSDAGIMLLQFALEQGLGLDVADELERRLFAPLRIRRTALKWHSGMGDDIADGWTTDGTPKPHVERGDVRAAGSMDTTPEEMAQIVSHIVRGAGISARARANFAFGTARITRTLVPGAAPSEEADASAALGVIAFTGPQGPGWFKSGHDDATANLLVCLDRGGRSVLLLSNDVRVQPAFPALVQVALGEAGIPWAAEDGTGRRE